MTPQEIAYLTGAIIGGGLLLAVIGGSILGYLRGGRETLQRRHQKAVRGDLKTLGKTERASYDGGSLQADLEYLCTGVRSVGRLRRLRQSFPQRGVTVRGCPGEDATGQRYYLAKIEDTLLAHRDLAELVGDAERVATAEADGDTPPATLSEYYADELVAGRVDYADLEGSVRGDCLTRLKSNLRRNGEVEVETLWNRCIYDFRYPPDVVSEKLDQLEGRDIRKTKEDTYVWQRY
jgi:hypothetical protein